MKQMIQSCTGFGHREVFQDISGQLDDAVMQIAGGGCKTFYTGAMGAFDSLFSSAVQKAKHSFPDIRLICVKPYMTNEINKHREYYYSLYDDIMIPAECAGVYYKSVITKRNCWMIDKSDIVLSYVFRHYGGAYQALLYAKAKQKQIITIG